MRVTYPVLPYLLAAAFAVPAAALAADPVLPLVQGQPALATVNGDPIHLAELEEQLAEIHAGAQEGMTVKERPDPARILDRLITAKLIVQEAGRMGLDELPEVQAALEAFERDALRDQLFQRQTAAITAATPEEVDRVYKELVREYRFQSVLIETEEEAKRARAELVAGADFEKVAAGLVTQKKAKGGGPAQVMPASGMAPEIAAAVASLAPGQLSEPVKLGANYALVKLLGVNYPQSDTARKQAEREALKGARQAAVVKLVDSLRKKYVKVNETLLSGVDYDSSPGDFKRYLADTRTVATIEGAEPVTVGELTQAVESRYFHGIESAIEKKRINSKRDDILDDLLAKRVVVKEARRLGLDKSDEYLRRRAAHREGLLFGAFVQKAVAGDVKVTEEEAKAYLAQHAAEFTSPEMVRLESLAFVNRGDAEDAIAKLRKGADFAWTRANAEGQADPAAVHDLLVFGGNVVMLPSLPEEVVKALSGAKAGDFRYYGEGDGPHYVLHVIDRMAPQQQKFEDARPAIASKLYREKMQAAVDDWAGKLRAASEVKVFATGDQVKAMLMKGIPAGS